MDAQQMTRPVNRHNFLDTRRILLALDFISNYRKFNIELHTQICVNNLVWPFDLHMHRLF